MTAKELFSRIITDDDSHKEDKGEILGAFFELSKEVLYRRERDSLLHRSERNTALRALILSRHVH